MQSTLGSQHENMSSTETRWQTTAAHYKVITASGILGHCCQMMSPLVKPKIYQVTGMTIYNEAENDTKSSESPHSH